jgi:hypothetical protein
MPEYPLMADRMREGTPDLSVKANDTIPGNQSDPDINEEDLKEVLQKSFKSIIGDRDSGRWVDKRNYEIAAYFGIKDDFYSNFPWPNSSNFPEPITPVLMDTGQSNIMASMFRNKLKTTAVSGIGPEDKRAEKFVGNVMNWQFGVECDMYQVQDATAFWTFLHGTGTVKALIDLSDEYRLKPVSVRIQNMYVPFYSKGYQKKDTDIVHQIIPWSNADYESRKLLKINGKSVYEGLDELLPGFRVGQMSGSDEQKVLESQITGIDLSAEESREMRFPVETYITFYPRESTKAVELIVWWNPATGTIFRKIVNKDDIRPFSRYYLYDIPNSFYKMSLPEKIRNVQEKANYTEKQITDASDKALNQSAFMEEGNSFDPDSSARVPGGMYEIKRGTKITFETPDIGPIIARRGEIDRLWDLAERMTGLTELFQGRETDRKNTATSDRIRTRKAENRFSTIYKRYGIGWAETCEIVNFYNDRYLPREKISRILGAEDYERVEELYPKKDSRPFGFNINGKFDYSLAGLTQIEVDEIRDNNIYFLEKVIDSKLIENRGQLWKAYKELSEVIEFKNFEAIVEKPPEANILSVEEVLQRIESGQLEVWPDPRVDIADYDYRLKLFKKTDKFSHFDDQQKMVLDRFIKRLEYIKIGRELASLDQQAKQNPLIAQSVNDIASKFGQPGAGPAAPPQEPAMPAGDLNAPI